MEFQYCRLRDVLSSIYSGGTPSTSVKEYWDGSYKWLSSGETGQRFISDTLNTITERGIKESSTKLARRGSIVMACAGQGKTRGQTSFLLDDMYVNQSVIVLNPDTNKVFPLYLFYDLSRRYEELRGGSDASSTRGSITTTSLKTISFQYPSIEKQKKIANILYLYDQLIEVNSKRVKVLEQMAENLYKEWFVRFRFPGHESVTFEYGLPQGWEFNRIGELFSTSSGGTPSRQNAEYYEDGKYMWVKTGELLDRFIIDTEEKITEDALKNSAAKIIPPYSLLCSMYAGVGKLGINAEPITCSQATCVFRPKAFLSLSYLFFWLKLNRAYLENISFGAAQQNISQDIIKKIKIMVPTDSVTRRFDNMINPVFQQILFLQRQIKKLTQMRDLLLPRLMSGRMEVNLEEQVNE